MHILDSWLFVTHVLGARTSEFSEWFFWQCISLGILFNVYSLRVCCVIYVLLTFELYLCIIEVINPFSVRDSYAKTKAGVRSFFWVSLQYIINRYAAQILFNSGICFVDYNITWLAYFLCAKIIAHISLNLNIVCCPSPSDF